MAGDSDKILVPAIAVKVDGTSLDAPKYLVDDVSVNLDLSAASTASFCIYNCYDLENRTFDSKIKKVLALGKPVSISVGHGFSTSLVFKGYIESLQYTFQETPAIQIAAVDVRRLMMENVRRMYKYEDMKTYSDVIRKIMSRYSKICDFIVGEGEDDNLAEKGITQEQSDFEFLKKLALRTKRVFTVNQGIVYFKKMEDLNFNKVTLEFGTQLLSFQRHTKYLNKKIVVIGAEKNTHKQVISSALAKSKDKQVAATSGPSIVTSADSSISDAKAAKTKAQQLRDSELAANTSGSGSCIGMAELIPGGRIEITKFDDDCKGEFIIGRVSHSLSSGGGFQTNFDLGTGLGLHENSGTGEKVGEKDDSVAASLRKAGNDNTRLGITRGIVKENWDKDHPGCIKAEYILGEKENTMTEWIRVMVPYTGKGYGTYLLPEVGTEVVIAFDMGMVESPFALGCLWNEENSLPEKTANEDNSIKRIRTKAGHEILLDETDKKEKLQILSKGKLVMELNDEDKKITIKDEKGDNAIMVDSKNGEVTIKAKTKLSFQLGSDTYIELDGSGKKASITCPTVNIEGKQALNLKGQTTKLEGSMVDVKSSGKLSVNASAILELKGTMAKIN